MNYLAIMIFKVFLIASGSTIFFTLPSDTIFETQSQCETYINSPDIRPEIMANVKSIAQDTGSKDIILSNMVCVSNKSEPI